MAVSQFNKNTRLQLVYFQQPIFLIIVLRYKRNELIMYFVKNDKTTMRIRLTERKVNPITNKKRTYQHAIPAR